MTIPRICSWLFVVALFGMVFSVVPFSFAECTETSGSFCLDVPFPNEPDTINTSRAPEGPKDSVYIMEQYVGMAFRFLAGLTALIAVLVIIFHGFKIMISGGDTSARGQAKDAILQAFGGIALLFLAALFLNFVNPTFFKI